MPGLNVVSVAQRAGSNPAPRQPRKRREAMNKETLEKAKGLQEKISHLKHELNHVGGGIPFRCIGAGLFLKTPSEHILTTCSVLVEHDIEKQLKAAEKEFAEL
jgi:hypothetical protein